MRTALVGLVLAAALAACHKSEAKPDASVDPEAPPTLTITKDSKNLLFSFVDDDGKLKDVDSADKVPASRRKQVMVRDLSKPPEDVKADRYLFLADLTREENGAWPTVPVSRYSFDRALRDTEGAVEQLPDGGTALRDVVVYGTSWCGACAQARKWLKEKGIPFVDKDVEQDEAAQKEMARKARRAGINPSGVPVIDVRGHLMVGFDPSQIEHWLQGT